MDTDVPKDLQSPEWVAKATEDELIARSILKHRDAPPSGVAFHAQQMAEKYLKAFLVHKERRYPKIHPLDKLCEYCVGLDESFQAIKDQAAGLTALYTPTRYPGDTQELNWNEAEKAMKMGEEIKDFVLTIIDKTHKK